MLSKSLESCQKKKTFHSPRLLRTRSAQWAYLSSTCRTHLTLFASVTFFRSLNSLTNWSLQYHLYICMYIYIYRYSIKGKSLLRRFDKSTTDFSHLLKPMDPLTTYRLTDRIAFLKTAGHPCMDLQRHFHLSGFLGKKMHTHWELCELNHHVAQRFFFWTFPQRHEKRISDTFSLNSGWSSLVGMPIFLMDNPTTVLRVSNYKSKYIINQHYWSRDFIFSWQTVLDTSALLVHKSNFGKKMNREHAKFENSQE